MTVIYIKKKMSKPKLFSNNFEKLKKKDLYFDDIKNSDPITIFYEKNEALKSLTINDEFEENMYIELMPCKTQKKTKSKNNELNCSNIILISERSCPEELNLEKNINMLEKTITKAETNGKNDLD
jgi:hypothetical protein